MLWLLTVSIQESGGRINSLNSDLVKTEKFGQEKRIYGKIVTMRRRMGKSIGEMCFPNWKSRQQKGVIWKNY